VNCDPVRSQLGPIYGTFILVSMLSTRHTKRTPRRPQATPATHVEDHVPTIKGRNIKENIGEGRPLQQKSCKRKVEHIVIPKIVNNIPSKSTRTPFICDMPDFMLFILKDGAIIRENCNHRVVMGVTVQSTCST
jgi:hypothetical protein